MGSNKFLRALGATISVVATAGSIGCSGFNAPDSFMTDPLISVSEGNRLAMLNTPSCILAYSDYQLDEKLMTFQITDTAGIDFGFNVNSGWLKAIGLNVKTKKGRMDMTMHIYDSTDPKESLADTIGSATATDSSFNVNLDLILFKTDIGYAHNTPLATLMLNTIKNGLNSLRTKMQKSAPVWSSPIVYIDEPKRQVIIPAGYIADLREGDQFDIYNIDYVWEGDPCNSVLRIPAKTTTTPVAIAHVVQLAPNAAILEISSQLIDDKAEKIRLGSRVFIHNLPLGKGEKSRTLGHSVHLNHVDSQPLSLTNGDNVNLTGFLSEESLSVMSDFGFYPRNEE